jgi:hypothetical protein
MNRMAFAALPRASVDLDQTRLGRITKRRIDQERTDLFKERQRSIADTVDTLGSRFL